MMKKVYLTYTAIKEIVVTDDDMADDYFKNYLDLIEQDGFTITDGTYSLSDYDPEGKIHLTLEWDGVMYWHKYADCPVCPAQTHEPCLNMKNTEPTITQLAHRGRDYAY